MTASQKCELMSIMTVSETVLSNVLRVRKAERSARNAKEVVGRERRRLARTLEENGIPSCSVESIQEAAAPLDEDLWEIALIPPDVRVLAILKPEQLERLPEMRRVAKELVDAGGVTWRPSVVTFD